VIRVVLWVIALLAIAVPTLLVRLSPPVTPTARAVAAKLPPRRVVPAAELPAVEPVEFVSLDPDDARAYNASVPFAPGPKPAARPFRFPGGSADLARAVDCLAAALVYEAGDDPVGERAVAQVVLNRLRHPAFPKTVCGVVFEGSTRSTGCQFTFTCDGALRRWRPSAAHWSRAQAIAAQALNGSVYRPVGHATHYHTDWVVPYWQSSLDKIAKVGTHLFFRWTGWWGTPGAFGRRPSGVEPVIAALAPLTGVDPAEADAESAEVAASTATDTGFTPTLDDQNSFLSTLPTGVPPELWPELATKACGEREECRFSAWTDRTRTPVLLPLSAQQVASMSFAYLRDRSAGFERTLWNCRQTPRPDPRQCMRTQVLLPPPAPLATPAPLASPAPLRGPAELDGVRRRATPPGTAPAPRPSASPRPLRSDDGALLSPAAGVPQRSVP
jgi:spore germination cell wall hydrolase CwlJ-like protein